MTDRSRDVSRIRELNDRMRVSGPIGQPGARWLFTPGVRALGPARVLEAIHAAQAFTDFDIANDPYGEHDFGAFDIAGQRLFWKIDYYDRDLAGGSPNPADAGVTCRVLTIMLASEY